MRRGPSPAAAPETETNEPPSGSIVCDGGVLFREAGRLRAEQAGATWRLKKDVHDGRIAPPSRYSHEGNGGPQNDSSDEQTE